MPIYEYQCKNCRHLFECIQKFSDAPRTVCPECGQESLEKCVSKPSFQLKGSGWYETDFKKKPEAKEAKKEEKKETSKEPKKAGKEKPQSSRKEKS